VICLWHYKVEAKLARRLEAGMRAWTQTLVSEGTSKEEVDLSMDTDAPAVAVHRPGGDPKLKVIICRLSVSQFVYLHFRIWHRSLHLCLQSVSM